MSNSKTVIAALAVLVGWSGSVSAQWRCDCTSIVDTCSANVVARGSWLEIKTDHEQCARVDYFVDGQPFVSVVVDGEDRQDWLARTDSPKIMVQSCQVCRDNADAAPAVPTAAPSATDADEGLRPLIAGVPEYPSAALARGLRGHVDVEFTVNALGTVENPRAVAAEPSGVFDAAAVAAVARWRYPADPARSPPTLKERVEFAPAAAAPGRTAALRAAAGPRNDCVREDAVYNYGDMVDVGLINACAEPLVVFSCTQGTGRNLARWVCVSSEEQGNVLVAPSDTRLGNRYIGGSADGARTYTYSDSFSVTRAPNSQYWWVACAEQDAGCRADARLWAGAVSGQSASVDPQARSRTALGRSY
jgi:TonB family protein